MTQRINLEELLMRNRGVDADRLKERLYMAQKIGRSQGRYRYNLIPPFGGRLRRQPSAEVGGPNDNIRKKQRGGGRARRRLLSD